MDVIVVVDMQVGLLNGAPKHDLQGVVDRINLLTAMVRWRSGKDPFAGTPLKRTLASMTPSRVLVAGWATDFCVDATVRSAVSNDHHVVVISDGHTLSDRPHLDAPIVIQHHNWVWSQLITNRSVGVVTADQLLDEAHRPADLKELLRVIRAGLRCRRNDCSTSESRRGIGGSIALRFTFARLPQMYSHAVESPSTQN